MSRLKAWMGAALAVFLFTSGCAQLDQDFRPGPSGPGSAYEAYLAGSSDTILVELDYAPGANWDTETRAEDQFRNQLAKITQKTVQIEANQQIPANSGGSYSAEELRSMHETYQDHESGNGTIVMHAMFLDGDYGGNVVGLAFAAHGFALFEQAIDERTCANNAVVCSEGIEQWRVMRAVAIHEAGHLFGLVDNPLPMVTPHEMEQDPHPETAKNEGKSHSQNDESVMFWRVENTQGFSSFISGGEVPYRFDSNDIEDARAIQQGGQA